LNPGEADSGRPAAEEREPASRPAGRRARRFPPLWSKRLAASVRVRVTATAMLVVVAALAVAALATNDVLNHDRSTVLMDTARQDASNVLSLNPKLSPPLLLPSGATPESGLIQVLRHGRVIAASRILRHLPALWRPGDPLVSPAGELVEGIARDIQVVSVPVGPPGLGGQVVVVVSMQQFDHTVSDVRALLAVGAPVLLLLVGVVCWLMVGRSLRPIERMRLEVAGFQAGRGGAALHRVPEPDNDDEVGRLARTLNSMLDRIEASSARERRFVADASHELRSPIANVRTELEVALRHPVVADWPLVASEVLEQNQRMERLVASLLLLARSDEGSLIEAPEPVDLAAVAAAVVSDLPPGGPRVELRVAPALVRVPAVYAERMVANLVENAIRFAESKVLVRIDPAPLGSEPGRVVLSVTDDGPGVPSADRQRIFERFVRLDAARDRGEGGFGLGLAIVADLSRFYGGTIRVEEAGVGSAGVGPGRGACFVLELPPAGPREAAPPAAGQGPEGPARATTPDTVGTTIRPPTALGAAKVGTARPT
jgi:signal transduction histidine kinase